MKKSLFSSSCRKSCVFVLKNNACLLSHSILKTANSESKYERCSMKTSKACNMKLFY